MKQHQQQTKTASCICSNCKQKQQTKDNRKKNKETNVKKYLVFYYT